MTAILLALHQTNFYTQIHFAKWWFWILFICNFWSPWRMACGGDWPNKDRFQTQQIQVMHTISIFPFILI